MTLRSASVAGLSLPIIGAMMGVNPPTAYLLLTGIVKLPRGSWLIALLDHSQAATTSRYAHLLDDPLRAATERVGAIVTGNGGDKPAAEVIERNRR